MMRRTIGAVVIAAGFLSAQVWGQEEPPQLVRLAVGMFSLHGIDPGSGTEYVRFFLLAEGAANAADLSVKSAAEPAVEATP